MNNDPKLKVVLFALTGFGNTVLDALLKNDRVEVQAVFTVKYDHPFPYYDERQLIDECAGQGVACHHDVKVSSEEGMTLLRAYSPDLIIVSTFKQIIRENVLNLPKFGVINFHPSLLPEYRGPCPTSAALLNDEKVAGLTVHYVTEHIDEGNILLQRSISVNEADNDGRLRQKLAKLSGEIVPEVIMMFTSYTRPTGAPQDHAQATSAPKPTMEDGYLERATDVDTIRNKVRAFNPLPGTSFLLGDERIIVDNFELIHADQPDGIYDQGDTVKVIFNSKAIRLYKKCS